MNELEAQEKVLSVIDDPTIGIFGEAKEYQICFVIYYQSKKFIASGDIKEMLVGHGPVLVCKKTGEVYQGGSLHDEEKMVKAFEETGNPFAY